MWMNKNELLTEVIKDLNRRKEEILDLVSIVEWINNLTYFYKNKKWESHRNPNFRLKKDIEIIIKSSIVIFYSHWEWLLKFTWKKYIDYLSSWCLKREDIDIAFLNYFINREKNNLPKLFKIFLENETIPLYQDMIDNVWNLDYQWVKKLFEDLWLDFEVFCGMFENQIISDTWLSNWTGLIEGLSNYKKWSHFLINYLENTKTKINGKKTLEKILAIEKNIPNPMWLVSLRHKIAHWASSINVDFRLFDNLSKITILLMDTFVESFDKITKGKLLMK